MRLTQIPDASPAKPFKKYQKSKYFFHQQSADEIMLFRVNKNHSISLISESRFSVYCNV